MNIQIFGKSKCFDTKKAERWFKERRIPFQSIDLIRFGMSGREFDSVLRAVGGIDHLIDWNGKSQEITNMKYMDDPRAKEDRVFDDPSLMKTPIVRNGKQATVGYCPEIWAEWKSRTQKQFLLARGCFFAFRPNYPNNILQYDEFSGMLGRNYGLGY